MKMKKIIITVSTAAVLVASAFALEGCSGGDSSSKNTHVGQGRGGHRMEQRGRDHRGKPQAMMHKGDKGDKEQRGDVLGGGHGEHKKGGRHNRAELNDSQKAEIKAIHDKYETELSELSAGLKKQGDIIKAEMMKDSPNKATIDKAVDEGSKLEASKKKITIEKSLEIKNIIGDTK